MWALRGQLPKPYILNTRCKRTYIFLIIGQGTRDRGSSARSTVSPACFLSLSRRRRSPAATGLTGGIKGGLSSATYPTLPLTTKLLDRSDSPATNTHGGGVTGARFNTGQQRTAAACRAAGWIGGIWRVKDGRGQSDARLHLLRHGRTPAARRGRPAGSSSTTTTTASTASTGGLHRHLGFGGVNHCKLPPLAYFFH